MRWSLWLRSRYLKELFRAAGVEELAILGNSEREYKLSEECEEEVELSTLGIDSETSLRG